MPLTSSVTEFLLSEIPAKKTGGSPYCSDKHKGAQISSAAQQRSVPKCL